MPGNRPSLLDVTQYCGLAGTLGKQYGAGRAAQMSKAFHALLADTPDAESLLMSLTDDERIEINRWHRPETITLEAYGQAVTLDYTTAVKEMPMGMTADGEGCAYDDKNIVTRGKADFGWSRTCGDMRVVFVGDLKKTPWSTLGPDSLQMHCYGQMFASLNKADAYVCGIWYLEDGYWDWGPVYENLDMKTIEIWNRLNHAIHNVSSTGTTGAHCRDCYARFHCKEHLLPTLTANEWLAPLAENTGPLTEDQALKILLKVQSVRDFVGDKGPIMEALKEFSRRNGGIVDPKSRKAWSSKQMNGSERVSAKRLREALGAKAEQYITRSKPYERVEWKSLA